MSKTLATIDPWTLPRRRITDTKSFPKLRGIYFVFKSSELLYIGKTSSGFKSRWVRHHRTDLTCDKSLYVAFWHLDVDGKELSTIERKAILLFAPTKNGKIVSHKITKKLRTPKTLSAVDYWKSMPRAKSLTLETAKTFEQFLQLGFTVKEAHEMELSMMACKDMY
jgi:hypothetical protein